MNDSEVTSFNGQPAGTDPILWCNGHGPNGDYAGGYAFRDSDYEWTKWVQPYIKNTQLVYHPVIQPKPGSQAGGIDGGGLYQGEVDGGYALNTSITGALNTWGNTGKKFQYQDRTSWLGGSTTSVPAPADAWLIMEQIQLSVVGAYDYGSNSSGTSETLYPLAVKEHWEGYFYTNGSSDNHDCYATTTLDSTAAPFSESVPLSYCDGHTKAIQVGQFLANTPTAASYLGDGYSSYICGFATSFFSSGAPNTNLNYPFWGLSGTGS